MEPPRAAIPRCLSKEWGGLELAWEAHAAHRPFLCTVNNNAEGSAPLSIVELATG